MMLKKHIILAVHLTLALVIHAEKLATSKDVPIEVSSNQRVLSTTPSFDSVVYASDATNILGMTKDLYPGGNNIIYAIDSEGDKILKFDDQFNLIDSWGEHGTGDGQFTSATDVAVDEDHNVYVCELMNGRRIQKFDSNGNHLLTFGTSSGLGEVLGSVKVDLDGNIWVSSTSNDHIFKFKNDGSLISKHALGSRLMDFEFDSEGYIHAVVYDGYNQIRKYDSDFNLVHCYGESMSKPDFITIDCNGNLYVTDDGKINIWTKEGKAHDIPFFGSKGDGDDQFEGYLSIIIDGPYAYVSDTKKKNVRKFDLNNGCSGAMGTFLSWGPKEKKGSKFF